MTIMKMAVLSCLVLSSWLHAQQPFGFNVLHHGIWTKGFFSNNFSTLKTRYKQALSDNSIVEDVSPFHGLNESHFSKIYLEINIFKSKSYFWGLCEQYYFPYRVEVSLTTQDNNQSLLSSIIVNPGKLVGKKSLTPFGCGMIAGGVSLLIVGAFWGTMHKLA